jgi:uncharacterized membrane protein YheB (UPF0754 family)
MVALGALSARPAAAALARTARRPPSAARASFSRAASKTGGVRARVSGISHDGVHARSRVVARASAASTARVSPLSHRRDSGRGGRSDAARAPRALALGGDDADADGADAGEEEPLQAPGEEDALSALSARGAVPAPWHRFLTRTTFVVAAMVVLYSASTPYGVNDQGVSFATATAKRLACVFLARAAANRVVASRAARAAAEALGARVGVAVRVVFVFGARLAATLKMYVEASHIAILRLLASLDGEGARVPDLEKKNLEKKNSATSAEFFGEEATRATPFDSTTPFDSERLTGWRGAFASARAKYAANPKGILLIPVVAAFVGWFTNWLAVKMIFYPIGFFGVPLAQAVEGRVYGYPVLNPLGAFGWQGIVPAKAAQMAMTMVEMVTTKLIDVQETFLRLDPAKMASLLAPEVPEMARDVARDFAPRWAADLGARAVPAQCGPLIAGLEDGITRYLAGFVELVQRETHRLVDLKELVVKEMCEDKRVLVELFQKCGREELAFLTNSGLFFGFLLGCVQAAAWLFYDNPWTLTFGGALVGLATNWIALKCIFEPVDPVYLFGNEKLKIQGLFLQRQTEVSGEFSDHLASKVLTSEKVWDNMLHGGKGAEFERALEAYTEAFLTSEAAAHGRGVVFGNGSDPLLSGGSEVDPALLRSVVANVKARLAEHVHVLHEYSDDALGLKELMRERMALMTPSEFERVLHPIFEQDELTLIVSGAVLGALAGFAQQVYTAAVSDDGGDADSDARSLKGGDAHSGVDGSPSTREEEDWEATLVSRARAEADAAMAAARAAAARRREARAARAEVKRTMKRWPTSDSRDAGRLVWSRNVVPPEAPEGNPPTKGGAS